MVRASMVPAKVRAVTGVYPHRRGVNDSSRAKLGVPRDLTAKINARANAMVQAAMVQGMVQAGTIPADAEIVEVNAAFQAGTLMGHRIVMLGFSESRKYGQISTFVDILLLRFKYMCVFGHFAVTMSVTTSQFWLPHWFPAVSSET